MEGGREGERKRERERERCTNVHVKNKGTIITHNLHDHHVILNSKLNKKIVWSPSCNHGNLMGRVNGSGSTGGKSKQK